MGKALLWCITDTATSKHASAGVNQRQSLMISRCRLLQETWAREKMRRLSPSDGRRGRQECSRASVQFVSFIRCFLQMEFQFL